MNSTNPFDEFKEFDAGQPKNAFDVIVAREKQLKQQFQEFSHLSVLGGSSLRSESARIPVQHIQETGNHVQIWHSDSDKIDAEHSEQIVMKHAPNGEIESIEVTCLCGRVMLLKFDYDQSAPIADPHGKANHTEYSQTSTSSHSLAPDTIMSVPSVDEYQANVVQNTSDESLDSTITAKDDTEILP